MIKYTCSLKFIHIILVWKLSTGRRRTSYEGGREKLSNRGAVESDTPRCDDKEVWSLRLTKIMLVLWHKMLVFRPNFRPNDQIQGDHFLLLTLNAHAWSRISDTIYDRDSYPTGRVRFSGTFPISSTLVYEQNDLRFHRVCSIFARFDTIAVIIGILKSVMTWKWYTGPIWTITTCDFVPICCFTQCWFHLSPGGFPPRIPNPLSRKSPKNTQNKKNASHSPPRYMWSPFPKLSLEFTLCFTCSRVCCVNKIMIERETAWRHNIASFRAVWFALFQRWIPIIIIWTSQTILFFKYKFWWCCIVLEYIVMSNQLISY